MVAACSAGAVQAVEFTTESAAAREGAGMISLEVRRTGDLAQPSVLPWRLVPGTATTPVDFSGAMNGFMEFAAGETVRTLGIPLTLDAIAEPDEQFLAWLIPSPADSVLAPWGATRLMPSVPAATAPWAVGSRMVVSISVVPGADPSLQLTAWNRPGAGPEGWTSVPAPALPGGIYW